MSAKATIGGFPCLASADVAWTLKEGVRPHVQAFDMTPEDATELAKSVGPYSLVTDRFRVDYLYAVNVSPGPNPNIKRVVMADRRVWWNYKFVRRYYNMRRNVGVKRIEVQNGLPEALSVVPKVWYVKWTLKNTADGVDPRAAKWYAADVVEDVFNEIIKAEKGAFGNAPRLKGHNVASFRQLDIEQLIILENGDQAMQRVLTYLPEAGIYVDYSGDVIVYSKTTGAEEAVLSSAKPFIVGEGDAQLVSNDSLRPRQIDVLFQYEPEMRFDFDETNPSVTDETTYADNVLPIPDSSLTINGNVECQGTWATMNEAFTAWGAPPGFSNPLSHSLVQKALVPFMDLWAGIELMGSFAPNADWSARVASLQLHYRRTYRISRHWTDRCLGYRPYRVATVNQATGTRAPAVAYADYCYLTGQRALFNEKKGGAAAKDFSYSINVKGHPALYTEPVSKEIDSNSKTAPATIEILDPDQGVIHVDYKIDPYRLFEAVLPSMMTLSDKENQVDDRGRPLFAGPSADATSRGRPVSYDAVSSVSINSIPKLTKNHKMSVILTCLPGAPNNEAALFRIKLKPDDVADILPSGAVGKVAGGRGPVMEIYIGASVQTARVAWKDDRKADIVAIFGVGNKAGEDVSTRVQDLVVNLIETGRGGASLRAIARAAAARLWATFIGRYEGEVAVDMNGGLRPAGWISEVTHVLTPEGKQFSRLKLPERIQPLDIFTFLDSSTRATILKLASPDVTQ